MKRNISLKDLADEAGCSKSTVSRALRGDRRISEEKRLLISRIAQQHGYALDLNSSRMMSRFRSQRSGQSTYLDTIALVNGRSKPTPPDKPRPYRNALEQAATELNLKVEEYLLDPSTDPENKSGQRINRILKNRNIRGLILFPYEAEDITHWNLDWNSYSIVSIGEFPRYPMFDRITSMEYEDTLLCLHKIYLRGFRTIGFISSPESEEHTDGRILAAYKYYCGSKPDIRQVPLLRLSRILPEHQGPKDQEKFKQWFLKHRPEVILYERDNIRGVLADLKVRVPEDVSLVSTWPKESDLTGIELNHTELMEKAVSHLWAKICCGSRGPSPSPTQLFVGSPWREGKTLGSGSRERGSTH